MVGIVAACFPTYRPIYKHLTQKIQSRAARVSRQPDIVSSGAGNGTEPLHTVERMDKSVGDHRTVWIPLEDDEEQLVETLGHSNMK